MYIAFMLGLTAGCILGIVFHHWWVTPDIKELQSHLRAKEDDINRLVRFAIKQRDANDA